MSSPLLVAKKPICWAVVFLFATPLQAARAQESGPTMAQQVPSMSNSAPAPASLKKVGSLVTLDFANAEIDAVARTMATITNKNVVVDPRVKGTMTLQSTVPITAEKALLLFGSQLRAQGYSLVQTDGIYLVLPEDQAKLQSSIVSVGGANSIKNPGQVQTQIFHLIYENASSMVAVLRPLISPNNTINVDAAANALIITDYGINLQRIARIIATLDVSEATGLEIVHLRHAVASDLTPLVAKLLEPGGSPASQVVSQPQQSGVIPMNAAQMVSSVGSGEGYRTTLIAEPRSNSIIIRAANRARLALARSLIEQLDEPSLVAGAEAGGNIHVVYLKNADAVKLAPTLRAALAAMPGQSSGLSAGAGASTPSSAPTGPSPTPSTTTSSSAGSSSLNTGPSINSAANNQPNTGGQIQADPATNSLIISAPEPIYRDLLAVIERLDQRRAQVYIESLIAEINTGKEADLGIQWQSFLGGASSTNIGYLGTNYGSLTSGAVTGNIYGVTGTINSLLAGTGVDATSPTALPNAGFNFALMHKFGPGYVLGALANFIQTSNSGNVLSTPTLLTLDNEDARIMVGQNVPIVTGSYANTGASSTSVNPFQTYDRQDVGITLRVRPQINAEGQVKLVIYQEDSSIFNQSTAGPITNKRAIETTVICNDGQIIALGGLLRDEVDTTENKVPLLGDIPILGNLFKNQTRTRTKSNLMVFLRPVIVRDADSAENFSINRYDYMRSLQQGIKPANSSVMDVGEVPVLPTLTPKSNTTTKKAPAPAPLFKPVPGNAGIRQQDENSQPSQTYKMRPQNFLPDNFAPYSKENSDASSIPSSTGK